MTTFRRVPALSPDVHLAQVHNRHVALDTRRRLLFELHTDVATLAHKLRDAQERKLLEQVLEDPSSSVGGTRIEPLLLQLETAGLTEPAIKRTQ